MTTLLQLGVLVPEDCWDSTAVEPRIGLFTIYAIVRGKHKNACKQVLHQINNDNTSISHFDSSQLN